MDIKSVNIDDVFNGANTTLGTMYAAANVLYDGWNNIKNSMSSSRRNMNSGYGYGYGYGGSNYGYGYGQPAPEHCKTCREREKEPLRTQKALRQQHTDLPEAGRDGA